MPHLSTRGAVIYYETCGQRREGQTPVLLIHGALGTGRASWRAVALRLEADHFVILPDRRGHGQSSPPEGAMSDADHALDMATLIRGLGFERAHVVGHGHGGDIAVAMLVGHPGVIQTCVVQTGDTWAIPGVSRDPDPEAIERERPFRARDLATAARPTLVVEAAGDRADAPGAFMARHIPGAELWAPKGVDPMVHEEILHEWLARLQGFWARRGTDQGEALHQHARRHHADDREGPFDLWIEEDRLQGTVLDEAMRDEAVRVTGLSAEGVRVLITPQTPWALINRPVDDLRRGPGLLTERVSQARLGEVARILESGPEWSRVRLEHDGYAGWIHTRALHLCPETEAKAWQATCDALVTAGFAEARDGSGATAHKLVFATRVPVVRREGDHLWTRFPDGRTLRLDAADLVTRDQAPGPDARGIAQVLAFCRRFTGVPYLWGGRTPYGFDCSGLAGTFYSCLGLDIPRDADQQYARGEVVSGPLQPGDLVFFGAIPEAPGPEADVLRPRITHVGISVGGDDFLHANGANWGVSCNSLNPDSPIQDPWLRQNYRGARRFRAAPGSGWGPS